MKEKFEERNLKGKITIDLGERGVWNADKADLVAHIIRITREYDAQGYQLTLRQLYYQLVAADLIPNHDKVYKKIGSIKDDCAYAGLLDWDYIEDRGRVPITPYTVDGIKDALDDTVRFYRLDRQVRQDNHVELWTEKDAISNILKNVTMEFGVRLCVNKGYTSSSAIYMAYRRFIDLINKGQKVVLLYFGDHDPSGLDMIRDITDRLMTMFTNGSRYAYVAGDWYRDIERAYPNGMDPLYDYFEDNDRLHIYDEASASISHLEMVDLCYIMDHFTVEQIGLTKAQIAEYKPPHNPAKITDPRAKGYILEHGPISWEVDALKPHILAAIVRYNIEKNIDLDVYNSIVEEEQRQIGIITDFANQFIDDDADPDGDGD